MRRASFSPRSFSPHLSDEQFAKVAHLAKRLSGLHLEQSKKALVQSRLAKRLRALRMESFEAYLACVEQDYNGECTYFISALTTNVTQFFREPHHFTYLKDHVLPHLVEKAKAGRRVRVWSAGCSTGQEAYSIAGTILRACPDALRYDFRVLATDIDLAALQEAKKGSYTALDLGGLADDHAQVLFQKDKRSDHFQIRDRIAELVTFRQLNLISDWQIDYQFDIIFCRNVVIYFDKDTQAALWRRFSKQLVTDGTLIIGHSERLSGAAETSFKNVGITTYRSCRAQ